MLYLDKKILFHEYFRNQDFCFDEATLGYIGSKTVLIS